mmetsp:Transcript_23440/g.16657  ORF Transcript_23440/g.16657 Transcript_23440/m.16657 type:complete len:172 (+) Transcript_23440:1352-1867(+)
MFYCLFDFEFTKKDFMTNPSHFKLGLLDKSFTTLRFWCWCLYAGYHSVVILIWVFLCSERSLMDDGKNYNFWAAGHNVYLACVLTVSFVLFRNIHNHNGWQELLILLGWGSFYRNMYLLGVRDWFGYYVYGHWDEFRSNNVQHLGNLLAVTSVFTIDSMARITYDYLKMKF